MNLEFIEKLVIKYLEDHPEVIEKLVEKLIQRLLDKLDKV